MSAVEGRPNVAPLLVPHFSPGMHSASLSQLPPPCPHGHAALQNVDEYNVPVEHALDATPSVVRGNRLGTGSFCA
jgi:hypothetical protein